MKIPTNRVVAFAGPYISLVAGAAATWIIAKANALGIPGLEQSDLAQQIASAGTFGLVSGLTWLGQSKWLKGHHLELMAAAQLQLAAMRPSPAVPVNAVPKPLPSDDEEFAMPPPGEAPQQPSQHGLESTDPAVP